MGLILGGQAAIAQTITGTIRGSVTDSTGASIPKANITATNASTGVKTTTVSDASGLYNLQFLPIGSYTVVATAPGFQSSSIGPITLEIDQIAQINVTLKVGSVSQVVKVSGDTQAALQTENSTLGTTISANTIENLPLSGNNFQTAGMFVPGAVNPTFDLMGSSSGTERDTSTGAVPSFNGNRQQGNNYVLDGVEINETLNNLVGYNPAPEAIGEMRVITANADSEYGGVNGGEMVLVTKGGTNQFHGSVYEYFEDQSLTANLWSNNYAGLKKGVFHQNQFGFTVGGPILRNKLFFFGDYEGYRNNAAGASAYSVATPQMRTGDFSQLLTTNNLQLYNESQGTANEVPYANNQISINNPVAKFLFSHPEVYPAPNVQPRAGTVDLYNYQGAYKTVVDNNQGDVRVDYTLSSKDSIMGRFSLSDAYDATPKAALPVAFPANSDYPTKSFVTNWIHTFSPSLVNELRGGYTRVRWIQGEPLDPSGVFGTTGDSKVGIPFTNQPFPGFSLINIGSNESNVGTAATGTTYVDNIFDYSENLTWLHGKHTVKFGAQIVRYQQNYWYPGNGGALGEFSYGGSYTGYGFADFVLDESNFVEKGGVAGAVGQRQYRNAWYVQDDWKLLPTLTVNLGLRYGYDQPIYEVNNKEVNVNVDNPSSCPNCLEFAGQNGNSRALYNSFYGEVMPRLGFAWQVEPKLVVRGGWGITDYMEGTGSNLRLTENAPFLFQFANTLTTPSATDGGNPASVTSGFTFGPGNVTTSQSEYRAWAKNLRPTAVQQFNLTTQYLITPNTTAQVGYVGELGQRLIIPVEANQWTQSNVKTSAPFYNLVGSGGTVYLTQSEGVENYNALQAVLRHRTAHGLEGTLNYTWSKSMTNNPGFYGVPGTDSNSVFQQNIYDPKADYGPSGYDTRQAVNGTLVYELPFGRGKAYGANWNRLTDEALGGWKVSGDVILYSGFPITITSPNNANFHSASARANQYRPLHIVNRSVAHWFGTDPSADPCGATGDNGSCAYGEEVSGSFGSSRVNTERAPGYRIIDMSMFKSFPTFEGQSLSFRADAFNAFNMASYAAPAYTSSADGSFSGGTPTPDNSIWGRITSTISPARQYQLSLIYKF